METIQMNLSQKQNIFSKFFSAFFESAVTFKDFQKQMTLIAYRVPKVTLRDMKILYSFSEHIDC